MKGLRDKRGQAYPHPVRPTPLIRRLYPERAGTFGGDTSPPPLRQAQHLRAFVALIDKSLSINRSLTDHSSPHRGRRGSAAPPLRQNHRRWRFAERVVQFPPRPLWERIGSPREARPNRRATWWGVTAGADRALSAFVLFRLPALRWRAGGDRRRRRRSSRRRCARGGRFPQ